MTLSLVVPVYGNEQNIPHLLPRLTSVCQQLAAECEVVFVIDGSPDGSEAVLREQLPTQCYSSQLIVLSRNFGSFNAIRAGLQAASGEYFAVVAADLQEPPELISEFLNLLMHDECDVCVGKRVSREESPRKRIPSAVFWWFYRRYVQVDMPEGGVDVFGCNRKVRDVLLALNEANSSLIGQLIWTGFRRIEVPYARAKREVGTSGWTLRKKWKYMFDSIYSFTDLPIRLLTAAGVIGMFLVAFVAITILVVWMVGGVQVPGYTPIMLAILFLAFANFLALGVVGNYVWRGFENSKQRPLQIVMNSTRFLSADDNSMHTNERVYSP